MCIHSKCFFICVIQHKFKEKALQNNDTLHIKDVSEGSTYYLFKWSKRKRNVTRLGSGSDNNRFNIQLSFATGSESATRQKIITHHHRQRMKIISQTTNTDGLEWTVITSQAGRTEFHINSPQDLFENTFLSSSSSAFKIPAVMMYCPYKVGQGIAPSPLKRLPCRAAQGREHAQPRRLSLCSEPILPNLDTGTLQQAEQFRLMGGWCHANAHFWAPFHFPNSLSQASPQYYKYGVCIALGAASYRRVSVIKGCLCYYVPMPSAKLGYSSSVKRGSGSSRKYSFNVPAMALTSISLIITDTSLLSERGKRGSWVKKLLASHLFFFLL